MRLCWPRLFQQRQRLALDRGRIDCKRSRNSSHRANSARRDWRQRHDAARRDGGYVVLPWVTGYSKNRISIKIHLLGEQQQPPHRPRKTVESRASAYPWAKDVQEGPALFTARQKSRTGKRWNLHASHWLIEEFARIYSVRKITFINCPWALLRVFASGTGHSAPPWPCLPASSDPPYNLQRPDR